MNSIMYGILKMYMQNLCIGIADPTQANWMVSEAGDPDMVSGDSIMFICTPQSLAISPINFHKVLGN